jgi:predicted RNase H-like HicB family nuclease
MMELYYPIVVVPLPAEDGSGYVGYALDLRGCMSDGETPEEAFANTREAVLEWLEEARAEGRSIPEPGTAAIIAKNERKALLQTIKDQRKAMKELSENLQGKLKEEIEALKAALTATTSQTAQMVEQFPQIAWPLPVIARGGSRRKKVPDDFVH